MSYAIRVHLCCLLDYYILVEDCGPFPSFDLSLERYFLKTLIEKSFNLFKKL